MSRPTKTSPSNYLNATYAAHRIPYGWGRMEAVTAQAWVAVIVRDTAQGVGLPYCYEQLIFNSTPIVFPRR